MYKCMDSNDHGGVEVDRCAGIGEHHYRNTIGTVEIRIQLFASGIERRTQHEVEYTEISASGGGVEKGTRPVYHNL